jgi:hypothetical protein
MATTGVNGWRFPTYTDSPDVPRDLGILGTDIAAFIAANPGPQGAAGPANVITVAATNTINPGQSASVTISGTSPSQSLTFNIPRGVDGVLGGPGPANVLSVGTVAAGNAGTQPIVTITGTAPSQTINFTIPRGDTGLTGATGSTGLTGPKGDAAATITVAPTVTTSAAGTNAAVTNSGTSSDVVLNFTIPRGADGVAGATGPAGPAGTNANIDPIATRISLQTTPTSSTGVNSNWYPLSNNLYSIGQPIDASVGATSNRFWKTIYSNTGTINTSDQRLKTEIAGSDLGLNFINSLNPVSYKFIEGGKKIVDEEIISVPGTRIHYGLIAQEVKAVLDESGVEDFAGWVKIDMAEEDSMQGLRYDQFIAPLIKAVQELTARVKAIEEA